MPRPNSQPTSTNLSFEFLGLIGLADPVRTSVPLAIEECCTAGIRVVMITGDYPATARSIGRQIGLGTRRDVHYRAGTGLHERRGTARAASGCQHLRAGSYPEQKLRIVKALKANGEIVAMTGDGVNDAPALKAAHIGVAMGGRGTDVARESAATRAAR